MPTPAEELRAVLVAFPDELRVGGEASFEQMLAAQRWLAAAGWAAPGWPVEHGGRGLAVGDRIACDAEYAAAGVPIPAGILGLANVGPALMEFGTPEQQASLPRILDGTEIWCQGFGVNGQKVWTSHGMHATHCMLLVRTDSDAPKHKGISVLLVPMDTPGIERRPIRMISGDSEFAEVFFTDVHVPASALMGPLNG